jgi:RNA polymerase sigma factor (sigma-70 family)
MLEETDEVLLGDVKDRENHDAWRRFVERYRPLIYGCCRGSGMDSDEAEEMTCEVLEKLQRALPEFDYAAGQKPGRFRAWLRRVTKNAVYDYIRRPIPPGLAGVGGTSNLEQVYQVPAGSSSDPERLSESIEEVLDAEKLERVMLLREAQRRVLLRVRNPKRWDAFWGILEGRSSREVADQLGMSVAAVLVAAKEMQDMLKEEVAKLHELKADGNDTQDR